MLMHQSCGWDGGVGGSWRVVAAILSLILVFIRQIIMECTKIIGTYKYSLFYNLFFYLTILRYFEINMLLYIYIFFCGYPLEYAK